MRLRRREYADKVNVRSMDALDAFIVQLRREAGSHDAGSQLWLLPHNSPLPEHRRTERTAALGLPISEQELIDSLSTVPFSGIQYGAWEIWLVRRIGKMLWFQAQPVAKRVDGTILANVAPHLSLERIAGEELQASFGGPHLHKTSRLARIRARQSQTRRSVC